MIKTVMSSMYGAFVGTKNGIGRDDIHRTILPKYNFNKGIIDKIASMVRKASELKVYPENGGYKITGDADEDFIIRYNKITLSFDIEIYCMGNSLAIESIPVYVNDAQHVKELDSVLGLKLYQWEW